MENSSESSEAFLKVDKLSVDGNADSCLAVLF